MGVINNLIESNRKIREINDYRPFLSFILQPKDTDKESVSIRINIRGFLYALQRKTDNSWTTLGGFITAGGFTATVPLSDITESSVCRIVVVPYGSRYDAYTYSNEFTVTRPASQVASASPKSKDADIFTESEVYVVENFEKE